MSQNSQITQLYIESMQQNTHEWNKVQTKVHFSKFDISFTSNTFRESPFKTRNSLNTGRNTNNNQISTHTSKYRLTSFCKEAVVNAKIVIDDTRRVVETAHEEINSILSNLPKKSLDSEDFDMKIITFASTTLFISRQFFNYLGKSIHFPNEKNTRPKS